ncbi:MAG: M13 family metallopeptidase, partial [Steroidobacteraceae bacterium]
MNTRRLSSIALLAAGAALACGCSRSPQGGARAQAAKSGARAGAPAGHTASTAQAQPAVARKPAPFELDERYSPCNDFFDYVNARWIAANPIPADHSRWGAFDELQQKSLEEQRTIVEAAAKSAAHDPAGSIQRKLGWLYAAGLDTGAINEAGFDPIEPQLEAIAKLERGDIAKFIDARFAAGDSYLFSFSNGADFRDATVQIGFVNQAGLGLPTPAYYFKPQYAKIRAAYVAYIAKSLELTGTAAKAATTEARGVMRLETALAKDSLSPTELRNLDNQYHFVTLAQADRLSPHFSWSAFLAAQGVNVGKGFSLSQPKFIVEMDRLLAHAPLSEWRAYLAFHTIDSAAPDLSQPFENNWFGFYRKTLQGQPAQRPRWQRVLSAVNDAMGMAVGKLYVAKYFPPAAKARAEQLVANIRGALKSRIETLGWMSPATKAKALAKLDKFIPKIGYPDPDEWRDWTGLTIVPGHYYENLEAASKFNYHYLIGKIGKKTDRREWLMTPQTVNAYYDPQTNTINFPAAILQPPFFFANGDDAVNYGGIGAVIGHESSHGFDDQGSQFDGDGNRRNWWTKQDKARFDARTKELVKQFDAYAPIPGKPKIHVNGELTLGENIADLGGLDLAYHALQMVLASDPTLAHEKIQGFTQDQRFFLNWARVWRG